MCRGIPPRLFFPVREFPLFPVCSADRSIFGARTARAERKLTAGPGGSDAGAGTPTGLPEPRRGVTAEYSASPARRRAGRRAARGRCGTGARATDTRDDGTRLEEARGLTRRGSALTLAHPHGRTRTARPGRTRGAGRDRPHGRATRRAPPVLPGTARRFEIARYREEQVLNKVLRLPTITSGGPESLTT